MRVRNNVETFEQVQGVLQALQWFTLLVGLGTVVAGVVGVSNIMLVSVAERTSEFGLRKALGATPSTIVWMVLQEAVVLTGISGWAGLTGGLVTIEACARFLPPTDYIRDPAVDIGAALAAVFVVVVAGAAAGFFPAYRAASIEPVEALRG